MGNRAVIMLRRGCNYLKSDKLPWMTYHRQT
jgi:hypothetical protein